MWCEANIYRYIDIVCILSLGLHLINFVIVSLWWLNIKMGTSSAGSTRTQDLENCYCYSYSVRITIYLVFVFINEPFVYVFSHLRIEKWICIILPKTPVYVFLFIFLIICTSKMVSLTSFQNICKCSISWHFIPKRVIGCHAIGKLIYYCIKQCGALFSHPIFQI